MSYDIFFGWSLEYSYWAIVEKVQVYCNRNHLPGTWANHKWMGQVASDYNKVVTIDLELFTLQDIDKYSKFIATTL